MKTRELALIAVTGPLIGLGIALVTYCANPKIPFLFLLFILASFGSGISMGLAVICFFIGKKKE